MTVLQQSVEWLLRSEKSFIVFVLVNLIPINDIKIACEYFTSFDDSAKYLSESILLAKKDAIDRNKRKWEGLLAGHLAINQAGGSTRKLNLDEIPPFVDRIPNPFDRFFFQINILSYSS